MERLTERYKKQVFCNADCSEMIDYAEDCECPHLQKMKEKLAYYEDLEEQGWLLKLPCKVGDEVWEICRSLTFGEVGDKEEVWHRIERREFTLSMLGYFGKTIFLTKAEAEKALAEMEK